jgi:hypothetical protein
MPLYRKKIVNTSAPSSLELPSVVKTTANNNDFFIGIDEESKPYKIKKSDLFAGLSTGGTSGGTTPGDVYFSKVPLLLHGDGINESTAIVNSGNSSYSVQLVNTGVVNSNQKSKFNNSSLYFNGNTSLDYRSTAFNVGSQNCTIEFFVNFTSTVLLFDMRPTSGDALYPALYLNNGVLTLYYNYSNAITGVSLQPNTWYYIAVKKIENITELWLDGTKLGQFISGNWASSGRIKLGENSSYAANTNLVGFIDEFRFTLESRDVSVIPLTPFPNG